MLLSRINRKCEILLAREQVVQALGRFLRCSVPCSFIGRPHAAQRSISQFFFNSHIFKRAVGRERRLDVRKRNGRAHIIDAVGKCAISYKCVVASHVVRKSKIVVIALAVLHQAALAESEQNAKSVAAIALV